MHVAVKKTIAKHLGEKYRHAITREFFHVHPGIAQALGLTNRHTLHALHHHHIGHAVVPNHFRNHDQIKPRHVASQLGCAGGFAQQVKLVVQVLVKLGHHLARFEALAIFGCAFHPAGHHVHQRQVFFNRRLHVGPQHLDSDFTAFPMTIVWQHREMHLGNGCAGNRCAFKTGKYLVQRAAKRFLDHGHCQR